MYCHLETRKPVWTTRDRAPQTTGILATAGGVVFAGAFDRFIRAYDEANGKVLWQTRLNDVSSSTPITFSVDGKNVDGYQWVRVSSVPDADCRAR